MIKQKVTSTSSDTHILGGEFLDDQKISKYRDPNTIMFLDAIVRKEELKTRSSVIAGESTSKIVCHEKNTEGQK